VDPEQAAPVAQLTAIDVTPTPRLVVAYGAAEAHDLLRAEAARFHHVPVAQIVPTHACPRCGSDEHGRPVIAATEQVRRPAHVSLARAGDLSIVAVTDAGHVGVDVEVEGSAERADVEQVVLHPLERAGAVADLTRTWVRKEAVLKAYGLGLVVDPSHLLLDDDGIAAWDSPHPAPDPVRVLDVAVPGHVAAVALLGRPAIHEVELSIEVRAASA
jgi:4'-phosphopantetheinyl transferase